MQIQKINLDFSQNYYRDIVVKQNDKDSRSVIITVTDNGTKFKLDSSIHMCNIRMLTPDGREIYNDATILSDGTVQIDFTEQMVLASGTGDLEIEIIDSEKSISTMHLNVVIIAKVYPDDDIVASDEFNALTAALLKVQGGTGDGGSTIVPDGVTYIDFDDSEETDVIPIEQLNGITLYHTDDNKLMATWENDGTQEIELSGDNGNIDAMFKTIRLESGESASITDFISGTPIIGVRMLGTTIAQDFESEETLYNPRTITSGTSWENSTSNSVRWVADNGSTGLSGAVLLPGVTNGFFGVPVSETYAYDYETVSGTNSGRIHTKNAKSYKDSKGQCWICDEVDMETGVYHHRINKFVFDGSDDEIITKINASDNHWTYEIQFPSEDLYPFTRSNNDGFICDRLRPGVTSANNNIENSGIIMTNDGIIVNVGYYMSENTVDGLRNILRQYPITVYYVLPVVDSRDLLLNADNAERIRMYRIARYGMNIIKNYRAYANPGQMLEFSYATNPAGLAVALGAREFEHATRYESLMDKLYLHFGYDRSEYPYCMIAMPKSVSGSYGVFRFFFNTYRFASLDYPEGSNYTDTIYYGKIGIVKVLPSTTTLPDDFNDIGKVVDFVISNFTKDDLDDYVSNHYPVDTVNYIYYANCTLSVAPVVELDIPFDGTLKFPKVFDPNSDHLSDRQPVTYGKAGQVLVTNGNGTIGFADSAGSSTDVVVPTKVSELENDAGYITVDDLKNSDLDYYSTESKSITVTPFTDTVIDSITLQAGIYFIQSKFEYDGTDLRYLHRLKANGKTIANVSIYDNAGVVVSNISGICEFEAETVVEYEVYLNKAEVTECDLNYVRMDAVCISKVGYTETITDEQIQSAVESYMSENPIEVSVDSDSMIKAVNHRGYSVGAPENTLPAYILSKKKGFEYAECDVAFTSDGVAVLLHDDTIDRTSNGSGNISNLTYNQLLGYDFGSWFSNDYIGTKIPTFEEFIKLCKHIDLHPYIELKSSGNYTREQIVSIVNMVKSMGMKGKVTYISFNSDFLGYVKDADATARLGYLSSTANDSVLTTVTSLRTGSNEVYAGINYTSLTNEFISNCIVANIPLEIWTVNDAEYIKNMNDYISGVTSDSLIATDILRSEYIDSVGTIGFPTNENGTANHGIAGQFLVSNGDGTISWASIEIAEGGAF